MPDTTRPIPTDPAATPSGPRPRCTRSPIGCRRRTRKRRPRRNSLDPDVAEHEREMLERGANQKGEGRLP